VISRPNFADTHKLGPDYLSSYVKRVMAVTPEDVRRIANEYLTPDKMSLVVVGDEKTVKTQVTQWSQ
jgi:predicted Zn-dependent peptidase